MRAGQIANFKLKVHVAVAGIGWDGSVSITSLDSPSSAFQKGVSDVQYRATKEGTQAW